MKADDKRVGERESLSGAGVTRECSGMSECGGKKEKRETAANWRNCLETGEMARQVQTESGVGSALLSGRTELHRDSSEPK